MNENFNLVIEIKGLPKLPNISMYKHWTTKYRDVQKWKRLVINACYGKAPSAPLQKAKIIYTRYSAKKPDYDNCVSSFKALQDGLKEAGIIIDDSWNTITSVYAWETAKQRQGRIKIEIREMEDNHGK